MYTAMMASLVSLVFADATARACNDESHETRVLGVFADGKFLTSHFSSYDGSEADPTVIDVLRSASGAIETTEPYNRNPRSPKPTALHFVATPLELSPAADDPSVCVLSALTPDGPIELAVVDFTYGAMKGLHCGDVHPKLWAHPRSALSFAEFAYSAGEYGDGNCALSVTDVAWFPKARIAAGRSYLRVMARHTKTEGDKRTITALASVVRTDSGSLPARLALARLLAEKKIAWRVARSYLSAPFAKGALPVFASGPASYIDSLRGLWDEPGYDAWLASHAQSLSTLIGEMEAARDVHR